MTLLESTPEAPESTVARKPDFEAHMPAARRMTGRDKKIPSKRHLTRELHVGWPVAIAIHAQLREESPLTPVSGGAPAYDMDTQLNQLVPAPPRPLPASAAQPVVDQRRTFARNVALVVPLLLVNSAAVYGQQGWAYDHLGGNRGIAVLFATAVESIGIYLAAEAHAALMAGDASARLRLGSYLVGVLVGCLNYAHFAGPGYRVNPLALTFGLLSSISPLLWSIRSRSLNRDRLRELGQVDPRAVRFSILRWALFPIRTGSAFRAAVWAGVVQPSEAVANADLRRAEKKFQASAADLDVEPTQSA